MGRKLSVRKILSFLVIIIFIVLIIYGITNVLNSNKKTEVTVMDNIETYGYSLKNNATEYYKTLFKNVSDLLESEYDDKQYVELISKMFIADFYTLNNKLNKNDIGGVEFVYSSFKNDFISLAKESIYKTVESNIYNNRKQELPIVSNVIINSIENKKFKYDKNEYDSYYLDASVSYEKDLGYPTALHLVVIKNDNKFEVAKMETI